MCPMLEELGVFVIRFFLAGDRMDAISFLGLNSIAFYTSIGTY